MIDLPTLQTVRLKGGMADVAMIAAATGCPDEEARTILASFVADELITDRHGRHRIMPAGREALDVALGAERAGLDAAVVREIYDEFSLHNAIFKQLVTDWQLRDHEPNDHSDAPYDASVLVRLGALHGDVETLGRRIAAAVPRLRCYPARLAAALERVAAGELRFLTNPMLDSYHQVWFELHEELIGVAGLDRRAEAVAGRAA